MSRSHTEVMALVEACRAWCALTGVHPRRGQTQAFIYQAVKDYPGEFADLSESQIAYVAGVEMS